MNHQSLAPVILFVYNRPAHTLNTLKSLAENKLASDTDLYIYADAAKKDSDIPLVEAVDQVIQQKWKFKSVTIIKRKENWGLAKNIIDGVSAVVKKHGKIIVLEDDLQTSTYALTYFNDALEKYKTQEKVMQIAGYMYPVQGIDQLDESFFFRVANSWGWATWDRAWQYFNADIEALTQDFTAEDIYQFSIEGKENFWKQVQELKAGKINSWAIRWYASVFKKNGLVLYPGTSMCKNIGTDGSGTHSDIEKTYDVTLAEKPIRYFPETIAENPLAFQTIKYFYAHRKGSLWNRGKKFLINKLNKFKK